MIEKLKTALLALLVCSSMVQSYLLAFHSNGMQEMLQEEYVETETIGTPLSAESMLFPQQIVLHLDPETRTVLYPEFYFYERIFEDLKEWTFQGLRRTFESPAFFRQQKRALPSVELQFVSGLPLQIFEVFRPVGADPEPVYDRVSAMWLVLSENRDDVDVYLINDTDTTVYEVEITNLPVAKVEEYLGWGAIQPRYRVAGGSLYVPEDDMSMHRLLFKYSSISSEQMEIMLFPDPGITRNLPTRDGTEIYSDGKRGLQIKRDQLWMVYTDPIASLGEESDLRSDLGAAVQFVNQRGGWNGNFRIDYIAPSVTDKGRRYVFRQFVSSLSGAHPILEQPGHMFGHVAVSLQRGMVSEYERSLIMIEEKPMTRTPHVLPGGDELQRRLENYPNPDRIAAVFPAYKPVITPEYVELSPVWAIELTNGIMLELP